MPLPEPARDCAIMERTIESTRKLKPQHIAPQLVTLIGRGGLATLTVNQIRTGMHRIYSPRKEKHSLQNITESPSI